MAKTLVNSSNVSSVGSGTLIRVYDKLEASDLTAASLELQFTISHELEDRGWELDEEEDEWVFKVH